MSFLSVTDYTRKEVLEVLDLADKVRENPEKYSKTLAGKTLISLFEKPSTRTRISFELAIKQLGGYSVILHSSELQLGRGETVADTARVFERYADCVMGRVLRHQSLIELSQNSSIPIINGLSDIEHPCQTMADLQTIQNVRGLEGVKIAYVGDANNVCASLMFASQMLGLDLTVGCPKEFSPSKEILEKAKDVKVVEDPINAVEDADVVYTDVWVSMGDEKEKDERLRILKPYQVNAKLMSYARKDAVFMHCLPAHRGQEVADEVMDSFQSIVFDQAENRLHAQKAILLREMGK